MTIKEQIEIFESVVKTLGVLAAGAWVLWKYVIQRENSPRIEFSVDINFVGVQENYWLIEIIGVLENKGLVPYAITNLTFDAKFLLQNDSLDEDEKNYHGQINIKKLLKAQSWLAYNAEKPAVLSPGIKMRYNYIYKIETSSSFILIHGLLDYGNGFQTRADKLVKVPKMSNKAISE